jgi:hypothetical protein
MWVPRTKHSPRSPPPPPSTRRCNYNAAIATQIAHLRKPPSYLFVLLAGAALSASAANTASEAKSPAPAPPTLAGKLIVGYQGWSSCPGDRGPASGWGHWFDGDKPTIDMLPDVSGFSGTETCQTDLLTAGGKPIRVFSSNVPSVVERHFRWMRQYGIDGADIQRFAIALNNPASRAQVNGVLTAARKSAEHNGRLFLLTYDLSGLKPQEAQAVVDDWKELEAQGLTASPMYVREHGRPVLGLWGFGFRSREMTPQAAQEMMRALRQVSEPYGGLTILGGVPSGWRLNEGDASADPAWSEVYRSFEILSPWAVGRFSDDAGADRYLEHNIKPDLQETQRLGIRYLPVVFPGFSWHNLTLAHGDSTPSPVNAVPRRCGRFLWHQISNLTSLGIDVAFAAMFDEVDEGTALFKTVPNQAASAAGGRFLTLDADGCKLPSDWYLKLSGEAARALRRNHPGVAPFPLRYPN